MTEFPIIVAGGGLAGAMSAITAAEAGSEAVGWLVAEDLPLAELRRKGSDDCLVTCMVEDLSELLHAYPRGGEALLPELYAFGPSELKDWCLKHKLPLVDHNGLIYLGDSSGGLAQALTALAEQLGVTIRSEMSLLELDAKPQGGFWVTVTGERTLQCERLILAADPLNISQAVKIAASLGHEVERPVPALFNLMIDDVFFHSLQKESVADTGLSLPQLDLQVRGALELYPWGLGGAGIQELGCRAARELVSLHGKSLRINWCPANKPARLIDERVRLHPRQRLEANPLAELAPAIWEKLLSRAGVDGQMTWGKLKKPQLRALQDVLTLTEFSLKRKRLASAERALCGGISLAEVELEFMASRKVPGLFFAGDILDCHGLAGGTHRQLHWTSGHAAGQAAARKSADS
ncbi:MAG: aminoacetone oxidase family FAD-binding enzyme [Verrucomicrobiota bacterium]